VPIDALAIAVMAGVKVVAPGAPWSSPRPAISQAVLGVEIMALVLGAIDALAIAVPSAAGQAVLRVELCQVSRVPIDALAITLMLPSRSMSIEVVGLGALDEMDQLILIGAAAMALDLGAIDALAIPVHLGPLSARLVLISGHRGRGYRRQPVFCGTQAAQGEYRFPYRIALPADTSLDSPRLTL
jgi:hypothetical protein